MEIKAVQLNGWFFLHALHALHGKKMYFSAVKGRR